MYRLYKLVGDANTNTRQITNLTAWLYVIPIPLMEVIILGIFGLADPLKAVSVVIETSEDLVQVVECVRNKTSVFQTVQILYLVTVLSAGCYLGYLIRHVDSKFEDVKIVLFAMYNITFIGIVYCSIRLSVGNLNAQDDYIIFTICAFMGTVFSSAAFVLPRLQSVRKSRRLAAENLNSLSGRATRARRNITYDSSKCRESIHVDGETFKILVCSANMGNAPPTMESMKAWIPEEGSCSNIKSLDKESIKGDKFHLIAIGMQEATWASKTEDANTAENQGSVTNHIRSSIVTEEENYLASVEGEDTIILRNMEKTLLGEDYIPIAQKTRGQMRLHIYALETVAPFVKNIKASGANTGVGNVIANKGGIVVSFEYQRTRLTFLSAHLAAHEGESYYQNRCSNVRDILRLSQSPDVPSKKMDVAVSSHHMFVLGDLNFRTEIENLENNNAGLSDSEKCGAEDNDNSKENQTSSTIQDKINVKDNYKLVMKLIKNENWAQLYSYDELSKGLENGDLLVDFQTLACAFNPTFKVKRTSGYRYNKQRTPSYTDRILYRSAKGLQSHLKQIAYEPCVDFITSDHKPIRGAFSLILNETIKPIILPNAFQLVFSDIECSDLLSMDYSGFVDPFVMVIWDSIDLQCSSNFSKLVNLLGKWPITASKRKTLNPRWCGNQFVFTSPSHIVNYDAAIYLLVYDFHLVKKQVLLGVASLSIQDFVSIEDSGSAKEILFDRPLERYGQHFGRIQFKAQIQYNDMNVNSGEIGITINEDDSLLEN